MAPGQASFPAETRLQEAREFRRVFAQGQKFVSNGFVLIAAPSDGLSARLGLALAKRRIRRAVDRNRVKRVLRESFRRVRVELGAVDIVVLARSHTATMSNPELFTQLARTWPRIARLGASSRQSPSAANQG